MPSDDESLIICMDALKRKHDIIAIHMALAQKNLMTYVSLANVMRGNQPIYTHPLHPSTHVVKIFTWPFQLFYLLLPPTLPMRQILKSLFNLSYV